MSKCHNQRTQLNWAIKCPHFLSSWSNSSIKEHKLNWAITCPHLFVILTKCFTIPRFVNGKPVNIPGHSVPLAGLGGFILVFGFLAFNGGSQVSTLGLTLIATNSCVGQHISRWRRWHCGLGNREHNLGRFDRGHCCAPPYQVQVDCQELCKNFNLYSLPKNV